MATPTVTITLRLDPALAELVTKKAPARGVNAWIVQAISARLHAERVLAAQNAEVKRV
jgi:predicted HicB family RNase H-like nuclease